MKALLIAIATCFFLIGGGISSVSAIALFPATVVTNTTTSTSGTLSVTGSSSPSSFIKSIVKTKTATGTVATGATLSSKPALKVVVTATGETTVASWAVSESTGASTELNDFIIDLYKPKIDKLLDDFQTATHKATKGDVRSEIATYVRLGETVDKRIAGLEEQELTPNRKAILRGVLDYLRDRIDRIIESKKAEITNSFDS